MARGTGADVGRRHAGGGQRADRTAGRGAIVPARAASDAAAVVAAEAMPRLLRTALCVEAPVVDAARSVLVVTAASDSYLGLFSSGEILQGAVWSRVGKKKDQNPSIHPPGFLPARPVIVAPLSVAPVGVIALRVAAVLVAPSACRIVVRGAVLVAGRAFAVAAWQGRGTWGTRSDPKEGREAEIGWVSLSLSRSADLNSPFCRTFNID